MLDAVEQPPKSLRMLELMHPLGALLNVAL